MARYYQVISADGHVETPPDVWVKYVPEKWQEHAPKLINLDAGGQAWVVEGRGTQPVGRQLTGRKRVQFTADNYYRPDGSLVEGAGDAIQRLQEQDEDGIDAEVLFPPVQASRYPEGLSDKQIYLSMIQAYNTFLAQDFCSVAPDRLIGNGVVPISGIDDAVNEMKRCAELGLKTMCLLNFPNGGPGPAPEDDRFWQASLDLGMRLSPHGGFGQRTSGGDGMTPDLSIVIGGGGGGAGMGHLYSISQLIATGVFDRFPDLKFHFAETNAGWMVWTFWKMDDDYEIMKEAAGGKLKMRPSEYINKHCYFSFIRDPVAMKVRHLIPWENLMWGSDFPHSVGSFPESRRWLDVIFEDVPDDVRRKILVENPCMLYGLDPNKPITETPQRAVAPKPAGPDRWTNYDWKDLSAVPAGSR